MPSRPNIVPPAGGINGREAAKEGAEGGLIGAALGGIAGFAMGGPVGAAVGAMFFAAGGSLAGLIAGASQDTATEASEMKFDNVAQQEDTSLDEPLTALEERLQDTALTTSGAVTMMRVVPLTTTEVPPEGQTAEPLRHAG